jgi:hypothetical protein
MQQVLPNTISGLIVLSHSHAVHSIQVHSSATGEASPGMSCGNQASRQCDKFDNSTATNKECATAEVQ